MILVWIHASEDPIQATFYENLYLIDADGKNKKKLFNYPKGVTGGNPNDLNYDISEDGKWLLFSMEGDIVLIDLEDTTNIKNLTNTKNEIEIMPRFNSDDTKIIYSSGDGNSYFNLFTMNVNGENKKAHTKGDNCIIHARYRPIPVK